MVTEIVTPQSQCAQLNEASRRKKTFTVFTPRRTSASRNNARAEILPQKFVDRYEEGLSYQSSHSIA